MYFIICNKITLWPKVELIFPGFITCDLWIAILNIWKFLSKIQWETENCYSLSHCFFFSLLKESTITITLFTDFGETFLAVSSQKWPMPALTYFRLYCQKRKGMMRSEWCENWTLTFIVGYWTALQVTGHPGDVGCMFVGWMSLCLCSVILISCRRHSSDG